MTRMPPSQILIRITLVVSAVLTVLITAGSLWTIHSHSFFMREEQKRSVNMIAKGLAGAVSREMVKGDYREMEYRLRQTLSIPDVSSALVTDLNGRVLSWAKRATPESDIVVTYKPATLALPDDTQSTTTDEENFNVGWHVIEAGVPLGWVRIEITDTHLADVTARVRRSTIYTAIIATIIVVGLLIDALLQISRRLRTHESEVEQEETRLSNLAYFDQITGLPNRSLLDDRLQHAIARSRREHNLLAVCFVDLDRFKRINDSFGHGIGDLLLRQASQRLVESIREGDTAARYGGDEFVLLLEGVNTRKELEPIIDRLLAALAEPYQIGEHTLTISASIGITLYPNDNSDAGHLIRHADHSMYAAKENGRNCYRVHKAAENIPTSSTLKDE